MQQFTKEWFDESSKIWLENKNRKPNGYCYRCEYRDSEAQHCKNDVHMNLQFCKLHWPKNCQVGKLNAKFK